jgi:hypothetical protein
MNHIIDFLLLQLDLTLPKHPSVYEYLLRMWLINLQAKIDFLKWYLSVNSSEIFEKFRVFRPKKKLRKSILACITIRNMYSLKQTSCLSGLQLNFFLGRTEWKVSSSKNFSSF